MWAQAALAATDAAAEAADYGAEPFYATTEFWVAVGFLIFMGIVGRTAYRVVGVALDDRADKIRSQLDEATRLAEEARTLLATYERKQREAEQEAAQIVDGARHEADRLLEQSARDLERALKRREELAVERIGQAEAAAVADVRTRAVDAAMEATRRLIAEQMSDERSDALIHQAIEELPAKLH
jgi:F-type H+-transporting ATPase subunit b